MNLYYNDIKKALTAKGGSTSRIISYAGLLLGAILLCCAVQMFFNIQQLIKTNEPSKKGSDFISISKIITNETMGQAEKNAFHAVDIKEIQQQTFIEAISPLISNQFRIQLSAGDIVPFRTDLFIESVENSFIDTLPPGFKWEEGQADIPIIFSSDFLEIYNVFAPGQGLPQLSQQTATAIPVFVSCEGNSKQVTFTAHIVGFSDRINSVLVPKTFLDWANKTFAGEIPFSANRVFLKVKDVNNPELLNFLSQKNYRINKDKIKLGRLKQTLQLIITGLGFFGLLVVLLAMFLFSFYLQLLIARNKENFQLLITIGYSPGWLSRKLAGRFSLSCVLIILAALVTTQFFQYLFHRLYLVGNDSLPNYMHPVVIIVGLALIILSVFTNYNMIRKILFKMI